MNTFYPSDLPLRIPDNSLNCDSSGRAQAVRFAARDGMRRSANLGCYSETVTYQPYAVDRKGTHRARPTSKELYVAPHIFLRAAFVQHEQDLEQFSD